MTVPGRSVRARLALLYTALLAVALGAFAAGMFLVLRAELERAFDASLLANAEHAAGALAGDVGPDGRLAPSSRLVRQLASTGGRVVVLDASGTEVADSSALDEPELPLGPADLAAAADHRHVVREIAAAGDRLRMTLQVIEGGDGVLAGYVAWADSTRPLAGLLGAVALALAGGTVLVVLGGLLAGLAMAGRALRPVADVTDTARAIALSGDFAARVEGSRRGDEVGELALAFNEMLVALEANHQALQRFLGDASHQLRTPLTSVRANLELAARPGIGAEERSAILGDAREEADRMGRLIADLLSLARAESGARLELAPVELDALLLDSVRRQRQASDTVRLGVSAVEPVVVEGDADRLRELLGILLDNAVRYTPAGGSVTVGLEVRGHEAVLRVSDTGIGLDPAEVPRLFERLYRGRDARRMRPTGTGLGLSIARWIVDAHGGRIGLERRPEGGALATVTLPVAGVDPVRVTGA